MRVAIVATMPLEAYSGGRYYAFMLAEALAAGDHEAHFITNNSPIFYDDLGAFPNHRKIRLTLTNDFVSNLPDGDFDAVILIPGTSVPGFYDRVELFSIARKAHLIFVNFESGNWFNALSPTPRPLSDWAPWQKASKYASVVLSISQEGNTWAKKFYTSCWKETQFDYCYPPINTVAADSAVDAITEKRILLFMRFSTSQHKGADHLDELFCDAMNGYTLVIILGKEEIPSHTLEKLVELAKRYNVRLELKQKLSDVEKFREYKRSTLVLFPSQFEGFGYPPVEAQYCNVSCVAFDLPVLRETCGDRLYVAESGNWPAFRKMIEEALTQEQDTSGFRNAVEDIVSLPAATRRLESILGDLLQQELPTRSKRATQLRLQQSLRINDFTLRARQSKTALRNLLLKCAGAIVRRLHRFRKKSHRVSYHPAFNNTAQLSNHYHRARWYLPFVKNHCEQVTLYQSCGDTIDSIPDYMAPPPAHSDHIQIRLGVLRNFIALLGSDLVLIWEKGYNSKYLIFLARFCGIKVVNVATEDLGAREYGAYASLIWLYLNTEAQRDDVLAKHNDKFAQLANRVQAERFEKACVFGTGPSLAGAYDIDLSNTLNIVCNSIVQDEKLLDYLNPKFICAGDVVSHFGVSAYAHRFRNDLINALNTRDITFVTTASFGALFLYHYPDLEDKVVLVPQTSDEPVFDLQEHFGTPRLDSTLNIHMLPLAATFCKKIWILGCDGKADDDGDNEDFWTHASEAQYHELVDSGLQCHPTFDIHRQLTTYDQYLKSTQWTIEEGEKAHAIHYSCLAPSTIPSLKNRLLKP